MFFNVCFFRVIEWKECCHSIVMMCRESDPVDFPVGESFRRENERPICQINDFGFGNSALQTVVDCDAKDFLRDSSCYASRSQRARETAPKLIIDTVKKRNVLFLWS